MTLENNIGTDSSLALSYIKFDLKKLEETVLRQDSLESKLEALELHLQENNGFTDVLAFVKAISNFVYKSSEMVQLRNYKKEQLTKQSAWAREEVEHEKRQLQWQREAHEYIEKQKTWKKEEANAKSRSKASNKEYDDVCKQLSEEKLKNEKLQQQQQEEKKDLEKRTRQLTNSEEVLRFKQRDLENKEKAYKAKTEQSEKQATQKLDSNKAVQGLKEIVLAMARFIGHLQYIAFQALDDGNDYDTMTKTLIEDLKTRLSKVKVIEQRRVAEAMQVSKKFYPLPDDDSD
ncbi:hypothetical protein BDF19DRAFT_430840 [Syncephalis fuscata]|nr:hypothetical protein BDF19DRAFT_430840 [Syncephalis fuscata]